MVKKDTLERWNAEKSAELYSIRNWSAGYFDVSREGHVVITPFLDNKKVRVSIPRIIKGLRERGLDMPVLLRVENILDSQISHLHEAFRTAMERLSYRNVFRGVFPIKVNQQEQVIEEITRHGGRHHHGLEAGSKAELIAALGMLRDPEACLVCNGYKDEEFIDLGLHARKMGFNIFFVLEMPSELELILERSRALGVEPMLGARMKLAAKAGGHWTDSGGDRSIFGLDTAQIVQVVDRLRSEGMLHCLRLLHYHLGSQIPNIRDIRAAVIEASRVYSGLVDEGAAMGYLDLGGGLAVDYDGSHTNFINSRNYTLDEYCADVVEAVMQTMDEKGVEHPVLITESGRALVAYYSVLLFNILDSARFEAQPLPKALPGDTPTLIENLYDAARTMSVRNVQESLNDAVYYRDEIRGLFRHGHVSLRQRALAETIFWHMVNRAAVLLKQLKQTPPELDDLDEAISDIYYANMSVFQSVPDSWAIGHVFPIMPVHRLDEMPSRRAILADITCDCDGKVDRFIDPHGVAKALPVHELADSEEYYLGVFLVGAYQETLGDLHNLLGDTNVVSIRIHEDGTFDFVREAEGDTVADVLSYVEFNPKRLLTRFRETAERGVREGRITARERREIMRAFEDGLRGYTYYER